jgi:glycosyltransferase involved in cell wall biosynthesis
MLKDLPENILITSANFPKGSAAANYLNLFCKGIIESGSGIEVYILKGYFLKGGKTNDLKRNRTDYGVRYTYLGFVNRSSNKVAKVVGDIYGFFKLGGLLLYFLKRRKCITIFAYNNELPNSLLLTTFCRLFKIMLVTFVPEYYDISEFSGGFLTKLRWYGFLINFHYLNRLSGKLIVFSTYIRNKYTEMNYPEEKLLVQPNLTDFEYWEKSEHSIEFTIGYSGTPYKKDGITDLLTAISLLKNRNVNVSVLIVGDVVNEKSIVPSLIDFCEKIGIGKSVKFTGIVPIEQVRDLLNRCEILAITRPDIVQTVAGFPTKLGEYFACRKTVLSTRIGDAARYFSDKQEIIFAEPGNPQSIADQIEWILTNRDESRIIALNGYKRAKALLDYKSKVVDMMKFVAGGHSAK